MASPVPPQVVGQAGETGVGDLVAAAQADHLVTAPEQLGDAPGITLLGAFQVFGSLDVAGVVERLFTVPGQVGQGPAQSRWALARALASLVAAHALVAGETQQYAGCPGALVIGRIHWCQRRAPAPSWLSIRPCQRLMSGAGCIGTPVYRSVQPRGKSRGGVEVHWRRRSLRAWARRAGAIRLRAPCRRRRLSRSGTLIPQTPSSISPWLTA